MAIGEPRFCTDCLSRLSPLLGTYFAHPLHCACPTASGANGETCRNWKPWGARCGLLIAGREEGSGRWPIIPTNEQANDGSPPEDEA